MDNELVVQFMGIALAAAGAIFALANFIIIAVTRVAWKATFVRSEERITSLEERLTEEERTNDSFRHKHKNDVRHLETILELKMETMKDLMSMIKEDIRELKDLISNKK